MHKTGSFWQRQMRNLIGGIGMMVHLVKILDEIFPVIWDMSMTAGYCILAVLLLYFLLYRIPRKYLYALWLVVAFRLICPLSVRTEFSLFNLNLSAENTGALGSYMRDTVTSDRRAEYEPEGKVPHDEERQMAEEEEFLPKQAESIPQKTKSAEGETLYRSGGQWRAGFFEKGTYIWAAGVLIFLVYFMAGMAQIRGRVQKAVRVKPDHANDGAGWSRQRRAVWSETGRIYECDDISTPFVLGILCPRIYLPFGLQGEQKNMVLLHEQYHIHRKDHLVKYLSFGLLAVYWFHPLIWAAWFCMCRDMEMSCDEKVLELLGKENRKEYSRTLLAFASEKPVSGRIPLAFGEKDVKSRIRHALSFQKPTIWAGAAAATLIIAVLLLLGTNGTGGEGEIQNTPENTEDAEEEPGFADRLYEARNPYVGDVSADGRLLGVISRTFPKGVIAKTPYKTELQTSEEPYEFHFRLIKEPPESGIEKELEDMDMTEAAVLMLALTDNLGVVRWSYESSEGVTLSEGGSIDKEEAAKWCGSENIKEFASSAERVQDLLDRIRSLNVRPWDSNLYFMEWYGSLPGELYEQAVPIEEAVYEDRKEAEPRIYILAQTEDRAVTVYGCSCYRYGDRGITIDYRTPDGVSHCSYMDEGYWGGKLSESGTEVYQADYDQDGQDEIALRRVTAPGRGGHEEKLTIFEIGADGTLESPSGSFTKEDYSEEIGRLVATVADEENHQVHVVEQASPSSVPLLTVPYGEEETVPDLRLDSDVRFSIGEEIVLETTAGLWLEGFPGIWYGHEEEEPERKLCFQVVYEETEDSERGYFTLALKQE